MDVFGVGGGYKNPQADFQALKGWVFLCLPPTTHPRSKDTHGWATQTQPFWLCHWSPRQCVYGMGSWVEQMEAACHQVFHHQTSGKLPVPKPKQTFPQLSRSPNRGGHGKIHPHTPRRKLPSTAGTEKKPDAVCQGSLKSSKICRSRCVRFFYHPEVPIRMSTPTLHATRVATEHWPVQKRSWQRLSSSDRG